MKRNLRFLLLAMTIVTCLVAAPINNLSSQKLINKELKSSSNENGRVFQWVKQTYVVGKDTVCAAFDLNGKRITPNGIKNKNGSGVYYVRNGVFGVCLKKKDKHGNYIHTAYNTEGKCIISETLAELSGFNFYYAPSESMGLGLFTATSYLDETRKESVDALYNTKGECLIPIDEGFSSIIFIDKNGFKYWSGNDKEYHSRAIYDVTGRRLIPKSEGFTTILFKNEDGLKFFCCSTNKDGKTFNKAIYDVTGKPLISKSEGFTSILFYGKGGLKYFNCETEIDGKTVNEAIYDVTGRPLIPKSEGFKSILFTEEGGLKFFRCDTHNGKEAIYDMSFKKVFPDNYKWIAYYESYGVWWCESKYGDEKYTYSKDLRYCAPGYYNNDDMYKFNSTKKTNPNYDGPYNFSLVSTPSPSTTFTPNSSYDNGNSNQNNNQHQTIKVERDPVPMQVWKSCYGCGGSGQCQTCYGQGWRYLTNSQPHAQCITCGGNGRCNMCAGQGGHYEVEYR